MLYWAMIFFAVTVAAGVLGFGGVASAVIELAQILFFVFLVLFVACLMVGLVKQR